MRRASPFRPIEDPPALSRREMLKLGALAAVGAALPSCEGPSRQALVYPKERVPFSEEMLEHFRRHPHFFKFATPDDLPTDLQWQDGSEVPEVGSPQAQKGGTYTYFVADFPRTLRYVGPDANGSFRKYILDNNVLSLLGQHPDNMEWFYPAVAREWAVGPDGKTVYFRLDPEATFSDGVPVRADDIIFCFYFMQSKYIVDPWYNDFYTTKIIGITKYDDLTIAIHMPEAKPDVLYWASSAPYPLPMHFFRDFAEDYVQHYQWHMPPTTGPYYVYPEDIRKGVDITLRKVENWWARDRKHYRYRFNPDRLVFRVVREMDKVNELFKKRELDMVWANGMTPDTWYNKFSESEPMVARGGIVKTTFYNQVPRPSWGLSLNCSMPLLKEKAIRQGLNYATNWELVCEKVFRGDAVPMQTPCDGYAAVTFPDTKRYPFDPAKAAECFARAGFTQRGPDGIFHNGQGQRLSFTITTGYKRFSEALSVIQQEARKAGVEYNLEIIELTAAWKKIRSKKHEIAFGGLNISVELYPRFWESFHSSNAYKPDGSIQPDTNNFTQTASPELDALIEAYDKASSMEEIVRLARQIVAWLHDDAAWIPAWVEPFYRVAYWRWVKWPEGFNYRLSRDADEFHVHWVDVEERERVKADLRAGKSYEPQILVFDQYKTV